MMNGLYQKIIKVKEVEVTFFKFVFYHAVTKRVITFPKFIVPSPIPTSILLVAKSEVDDIGRFIVDLDKEETLICFRVVGCI